jgi:hypothetical protein
MEARRRQEKTYSVTSVPTVVKSSSPQWLNPDTQIPSSSMDDFHDPTKRWDEQFFPPVRF